MMFHSNNSYPPFGLDQRDVVTCLSLSSDGRTLISGSKDGSLAIWEVKLPETKQQALP